MYIAIIKIIENEEAFYDKTSSEILMIRYTRSQDYIQRNLKGKEKVYFSDNHKKDGNKETYIEEINDKFKNLKDEINKKERS